MPGGSAGVIGSRLNSCKLDFAAWIASQQPGFVCGWGRRTIFYPHKPRFSVHASCSAPWYDHARPRSSCLCMRDRPGHVSVPQLDDRSSEPVVKTRIRAPHSVVFPMQLRSLCVTERLGTARRFLSVGIRCMPRHPSLAWRSPRPSSPDSVRASNASHARPGLFQPGEGPFSAQADHEALRRRLMISTGSTPPASPCGVAQGRTGVIVPQEWSAGKPFEDYFPISRTKR
jgi:hypothetical protein